jgi:hypothetical protein
MAGEGADAVGIGISRRQFMAQSAALGTALAALAAAPGPLRELLGTTALGQGGELSPDNLRTFVAATEAVCSFDGTTPPPGRVNGRSHPTAADAAASFANEYRNQYPAFRQTADIVLSVSEQAPRTPPPVGAVTTDDFAAYGGRSFTELDIPLRLRLIRSWLTDHNPTPVDPQNLLAGIRDVGTLHRAIAIAAIQLPSFFYYRDPRAWAPIGWTGAWLGRRRHKGEDLPFSHHDHQVYGVRFGQDTASFLCEPGEARAAREEGGHYVREIDFGEDVEAW